MQKMNIKPGELLNKINNPDDLKKLTREEITTGIDSEKWIWTSRQKTETTTRVPLMPRALEILDRYKDDPQCLNQGRLLPVLSNQKMNNYLKEISEIKV